MKVVGFNQTGSVSNIEVLESPAPGKLKEGEVRLKFLSGSLNHLDLWVIKGLPHIKYQFPHIAGSDFCGKVVESRSEKFKIGDRVLVYPGGSSGTDAREYLPENLRDDFLIRGENSPGVLREELVEPEKYLTKAPEHLTDERAGAIPLAFLTAWQMVVEKGFSQPNYDLSGRGLINQTPTGGLKTSATILERIEPVLVHAAVSGVSQAILELLLSFGFKKIAATSRSEEKLEIWKKRGVQGFISGPNLETELKTWAGKTRFGLIFDHVGEVYFEMNIRLLRKGGKFITCGSTSGFKAALDLRHVFFRQLQLLGSTMGSVQQFKTMVNWVAERKIVPLVSHTFPFDNPKPAYELMEAGRQNGKIVLTA
ncbi:MAG: zinc-binding dehydrogenase [candidate division Zixibacteria bacterium]|nr:zinc-binding dehydrogenase [candidate division Zixibacteria bacterium]